MRPFSAAPSETLAGIGPVAADLRETDGTRVVVLLPDLDTLLGTIGFDLAADAIVLPGTARLDGWTLFGRRRAMPRH